MLPDDEPSNTVCVAISPAIYPATLQEIAEMFAGYGDIARVDLTSGPQTGRVSITFFDVRSAIMMVREVEEANFSKMAHHDFRGVTLAASVFQELTASQGGLAMFGEVADVNVQGEEVVVDFFDMRAAQRASLSVRGSSLRPAQAGAQMSMSPKARLGEDSDFSFSASTTPVAAQLPRNASPASSPTNGDRGAARRPTLLEKKKDLMRFEINPENILKGADTRTTVMIRNIAKELTKASFVQLLHDCGLEDRYSFLYMPFDKRRSVHCGFSFVDFKSPTDILTLYKTMRTKPWLDVAAGQAGEVMPPALSYARLQGREELEKHFSLSTVMRDKDARKRPLFCGGDLTPGGSSRVSTAGARLDSGSTSSESPKRAVSIASTSPPSPQMPTTKPTAAKKTPWSMSSSLALQPQYVPLPDMSVPSTCTVIESPRAG